MDAEEFDHRFPALASGLELEELDTLVAGLVRLEIAAGEVLITEGTTTDSLFLVWDGQLEVSVGSGDDEVELGIVEAGGYVGEVSLLDPGPAAATARSEQGATVLTLGHDRLRELDTTHPAATAAIMRVLGAALVQRVRATSRLLAPHVAAAEATPPSESIEPALDMSEALRRLPGLDQLHPDERARLAEAAVQRTFEAGTTIGHQGARPGGVHVVLAGAVGRHVFVDGSPRELAAIAAGALAGAEGAFRSTLATGLVANAPTTTAFLSAEEMLRVGLEHPRVPGAMDRAAASRLAAELRVLTGAYRGLAPRLPTGERDVAVIGGGMNGLAYAWFLKDLRPRTSVTVLERRAHPGYKIGESTLGTTSRCMRRMGLDMPVLRRLFGIKAGIRFWWTSAEDPELHAHVDAGDVDETFQVERRVLETALLETARRHGIEVRTGTRVNVPASHVGDDEVVLRCEPEHGSDYDLAARIVCDASGPASVLPRRFGAYRRDPQRLATFNTNSYYAYFRQVEDVPLEFWDQPATRHVCFDQGWCWFITARGRSFRGKERRSTSSRT